MIFDLDKLKPADVQYYLQHVVAPRPICFASTMGKEGHVNLSPFSFFNMFSSNPPIVIFSPSRRLRDNSTKHTLENVKVVPEVVINMVTWDMVQQVSLASSEYPKAVDEFIKAGFTKEPATVVKPPMVKESKAKMECKVIEIKSLGENGGAGQLVICEVLVLHIDDILLHENKIDSSKLDLVARMGGDWYCRASKENIFGVPKPNLKVGIGMDGLPEPVRGSNVLTGNHLALLAGVEAIPAVDPGIQLQALRYYKGTLCARPKNSSIVIHEAVRHLLEVGKIDWAWQVLLLETSGSA